MALSYVYVETDKTGKGRPRRTTHNVPVPDMARAMALHKGFTSSPGSDPRIENEPICIYDDKERVAYLWVDSVPTRGRAVAVLGKLRLGILKTAPVPNDGQAPDPTPASAPAEAQGAAVGAPESPGSPDPAPVGIGGKADPDYANLRLPGTSHPGSAPGQALIEDLDGGRMMARWNHSFAQACSLANRRGERVELTAKMVIEPSGSTLEIKPSVSFVAKPDAFKTDGEPLALVYRDGRPVEMQPGMFDSINSGTKAQAQPEPKPTCGACAAIQDCPVAVGYQPAPDDPACGDFAEVEQAKAA